MDDLEQYNYNNYNNYNILLFDEVYDCIEKKNLY